eukprot:3504022-Amphidinium_carterae.1
MLPEIAAGIGPCCRKQLAAFQQAKTNIGLAACAFAQKGARGGPTQEGVGATASLLKQQLKKAEGDPEEKCICWREPRRDETCVNPFSAARKAVAVVCL